MSVKRCLACGKKFEVKEIGGAKRRKFCSAACSHFYWRLHLLLSAGRIGEKEFEERLKQRREGLRERRCSVCGKTFQPRLLTQTYCSKPCKWKANYQAKRERKAVGA